MLRMINMKSRNIHKCVELKCPLHISNRGNSDSRFVPAVSYTVYKDICAALAQASNQLLSGNSVLAAALIAVHNGVVVFYIYNAG